jgi:iron(III) transport system permease protein
VSAFKPTGFLLDPGFTLDHVRETWGSGDLWRVFGRTLVFALGASALALLLGLAMAWIVERTDLRARGLIRALLVLPMAMPPFLLAMGWTMLLSPRSGLVNSLLASFFSLRGPVFDIYTIQGMIFVEGLSLAPSAFLMLAPALRNIDASLEEAALMCGAARLRMTVNVVLPLIWPAMAGTGAYLLVVSCMVFDVPGTIGMPAGVETLSTRIYDLVNNNPTGLPDYGATSAVALLIICCAIVLLVFYQRLMAKAGRYVTVTGKNFKANPIPLGRLAPLAGGFVALYLFLAVAAPLVTLIWSSFLPYQMAPTKDFWSKLTLANHHAIIDNPAIYHALGHSLVIALCAASFVAIVALLTSWIVLKARPPGARLLDGLIFLPLAVPGVLIGTALIYVYISVPILPIYGTIWIITVAHATVYLSYASRATNAAVAQIHNELDEAARMSGAGFVNRMRRIVFPLALPAFGAVWLWVFSHSLRELSAALMLQGVDNGTVTTLLFSFWSQGQPTKSAAIGVWLALILFVFVGAGQALQALAARRRG